MMRVLTTKYSIFAAAALSLAAAPIIAFAQSSSNSSTPLSGLYACEGVADDAAQLACFRAETAKLRAEETTGEVIAVDKESFAEIKKEEVKKAEVKKEKQKKEKKAKTPKIRTLAIKSARPVGLKGFYRFTLENGEVWEQTKSARVRLGGAEPDVLIIRKGSLGSHFAKVNDTGNGFRVTQKR